MEDLEEIIATIRRQAASLNGGWADHVDDIVSGIYTLNEEERVNAASVYLSALTFMIDSRDGAGGGSNRLQ